MTYLALGDSSPLWNDFEVVIRPEAEDGIILYNGNDGSRDEIGFTLFSLSSKGREGFER